MTGKELRELIADVPDDAPVNIALVRVAGRVMGLPSAGEDGYCWFDVHSLEEFSKGFDHERDSDRFFLLNAGELTGEG